MHTSIVTIAVTTALVFANASHASALVACPENEPNCKSNNYSVVPSGINVAPEEDKVNVVIPAAAVFIVVVAGVGSYIVYKKKQRK